ncbi:MAG TPA: HupE/UreJ family protein [Steroidobacteraceae bacterium]|nr:HupE/UreJ family protein [Steroidobacteraceae bacterium]
MRAASARAGVRCALWALLGLVTGTPGAQAHTRSESHSAWQITGPSVRVQFTVPDLEARRLATPGSADPSDAVLAAYLAANLGASSHGAACPPSAAPRAVRAAGGYRRFEFQFRCSGAEDIQLHSTAFFELVATHTNFAQIRDADGNLVEQLFTLEHPSLELGGGDSENRLQSAGFFEYVMMGILHIFTGVDHQAFLLGLVLISRRPRDLVFVVTGFTLGHSLTLALAVTGVIRPHAEYIDALVGLTIALIGAENIIANSHRPLPVALGVGGLLLIMAAGRWLGLGGLPIFVLLGGGLFAANYLMVSGRLRDAARVRIVVTLVFGLIHGFGFASNLLEMRLPAGRLAELLVGFNLGVELAQLAFVGLALLAALGLMRLRLGLPRRLVTDVLASFLVGLGMYWFVLRSYA